MRKRRWPIATYNADREEFSLPNGQKFSLSFFKSLPVSTDHKELERASKKMNVPVAVWFACYKELADEDYS